MLYDIIRKLDSVLGFEQVKAHCDIPCGIYDPAVAQIAALTVIRMIDLANELEKEQPNNLQSRNNLARYIAVKEEYAEKCKHEIRVIWGDYFKPEHFQKHPDLNSLVHDIMQQGSSVKHSIDRAEGVKLLKSINQFAKIFWETKDVSTKLAKAPYEPGEQVAYPAF